MTPQRVVANLREVRDRIVSAARRSGRSADAVRLVAVTKTIGEDLIRVLVGAGQRDLGENRAQQLRDRAAALGDLPIAWHMIGRLQRKNIKYIVPAATMIHSVDSPDLAEELGRRALAASPGTAGQAGRGTPTACLLEINSGEEQKGGVAPEDAADAASAIAIMGGINLVGLMTMAPLVEDPETVRPTFARLRELLARINREAALPHPLMELSMGMTQDYEVAVEEGATIVRVGTALFR